MSDITLPAITTETEICNMSLGRLGSSRLDDYDTDTSVVSIHCRLHYPLTRDVLLRSHDWSFATKRVILTDKTTPDFEFDHAYQLPSDFLRFNIGYELDTTSAKPYVIEGTKLLTNEDDVYIVYIAQITEVSKFDCLFTELLVLQLALKLIPPILGTGSTAVKLKEDLQKELAVLMKKFRAINRQEQTASGRQDWYLSRTD